MTYPSGTPGGRVGPAQMFFTILNVDMIMPSRRRQFLMGLGVVTLGNLAGCNSGDSTTEDTPTNTDTTLASDEQTTTVPPTATLTPTATATQTPTRTQESSSPIQSAKLDPESVDENDWFGERVVLSADGSTVLVGAKGARNSRGRASGSVYVFSKNGGTWTQQGNLFSSDGKINDKFGASIAMSRDESTIIVGAAADETSNGGSAGSAYVFSKVDGTWIQQDKLVPTDGTRNEAFGQSVALSEDGAIILVGASNSEKQNGSRTGAAYVFSRRGDTWKQQTKLVPGPGTEGAEFGHSVALSEDATTALVGAHMDDSTNGTNAGAAYLFVRTDGSWTQQGKLSPKTGDKRDRFGGSLALSDDGTTAIVGAPTNEDPNGSRAGSVHVFSLTKRTWNEKTTLAPADGDTNDRFGASVAVSKDGNTALVGALKDEDPNGPEAGSAYVFSKSNGFWNEVVKLAPDDGKANDQFGVSVALSNDSSTGMVGAWRDKGPSREPAGSAYVYDL